MAPVLGLLVVVGVEVHVVEDDGVGGGQVDAQAARAGAQDEHEDGGVVVVLVDQLLPANNKKTLVDTEIDWRARSTRGVDCFLSHGF